MKKTKNNSAVLHGNEIRFGNEGICISFQRTLRIPDNGRRYPLPPGLGRFPLRSVDDYRDRVPAEWLETGGVFLPMYQREAMWIHMRGPSWNPRAVKFAVGKVCAITGKPWKETLSGKTKQDYVVTPPQPWIDGICSGQGTIRQFVAMPLGMGYTVEGQVTGEEIHGGLQIKVFEPIEGRFQRPPPAPPARSRSCAPSPCAAAPSFAAMPAPCAPPANQSMGLAAGGQMKQKIYPDPYGRKTWDAENTGRVFVHIVNSEQWRDITGETAPNTPIMPKQYFDAGLPWYDLYDEHKPTLKGSKKLDKVKSVDQLDDAHGTPSVKILSSQEIRDGKW